MGSLVSACPRQLYNAREFFLVPQLVVEKVSMSGAEMAARKRRAKAQPTKRSTKAKTSPAEKRAPAKAASRNSLIFASFRNAPGCLPVSPYDGGHNHVHILQVTSANSYPCLRLDFGSCDGHVFLRYRVCAPANWRAQRRYLCELVGRNFLAPASRPKDQSGWRV